MEIISIQLYDFFRAKTINCALQWITLTYWLFGTVICTTLFVLHRYTNVNIFEEEEQSMFTKSPSQSKVGVVTNASERIPPIENNDLKTIEEKDDDVNLNEQDASNASQTGAVILLNEIVTKAASAANNRRLQNDFNSIKF